VIGQVLGCDDLEFAWGDRTAPDPQTQATIAAAYVGAGIKTRNEVRAELGLDPIAGGDVLTTATPAAALPGGWPRPGSIWISHGMTMGAGGPKGGSGVKNKKETNLLSAAAPRDNHTGGRILLAQEILPFDDLTAFGRPPFSLRGLPDEVLNQFKETVPRRSGKAAADDPPSWARGSRPMIRESGKDFARRLLDEHYGPGNWDDEGPKSEYTRIKKWGIAISEFRNRSSTISLEDEGR